MKNHHGLKHVNGFGAGTGTQHNSFQLASLSRATAQHASLFFQLYWTIKDLMQTRQFSAGYPSHSPGREETWVLLVDRKVAELRWTKSVAFSSFFVHFLFKKNPRYAYTLKESLGDTLQKVILRLPSQGSMSWQHQLWCLSLQAVRDLRHIHDVNISLWVTLHTCWISLARGWIA